MFQRPTLSAAVGLSLVVGLSGCGSKKAEKDIYNPPAPKIIRQGESVDFKAWSDDSAKSLDLQDEFDVSGGSPASVEINGHCVVGDTAFSSTASFANAKQIRIFKAIPQEVLVSDIQAPVKCNFDLIFKNDLGSRHIFGVPAATITDTLDTRLEMLVRPEDVTVNRSAAALALEQAKFSAVEIRRTGTGAYWVQLVCTDVTFTAIAFDHVIALSDFDLNSVQSRPGRAENILSSRAAQVCRVNLLDSQNSIEDVGPAFTVRFETGAPKIELISAPYREAALNLFDYQAVLVQNSGNATAIEFSTLRISNPSPGARYFRLARGLRFIEHKILLMYMTGGGPHNSRNYSSTSTEASSMTISLAAEGGASITEPEGNYDLVLPPGSSVVLSAVYVPKFLPGCHAIAGYAASSLLPETLHELTDLGQPLASYTFNWGPRQTFAPAAPFPAERPASGNPKPAGCSY